MYISYIIYIILNSRCCTGVGAPKLSHRSSYIKEPFGKGLDGLPGGWTGASEGLEGGLRGLRPVQGGFKGAWEGLQGGFKGAWEGLEGGLLEGGLRRASRGLQGGLRRAWRGLQGEGGLKGAWEGLQGGLRRASRGLEKGFKGASRGLQALLTFVPPPPGRDPSSPPWRVPSKVVARIQPQLLRGLWQKNFIFSAGQLLPPGYIEVAESPKFGPQGSRARVMARVGAPISHPATLPLADASLHHVRPATSSL